MTTFLLVHGAFHGAWSWQPLIPHLTASGHNAIAMDVPIDDERAGWRGYIEAVLDAAPESLDTVLVGHSRAGRLLPLLLERRRFAAVVFIAAALPNPIDTPARQCDTIPMLLPSDIELTRDEYDRIVCPPERAKAMYYHDLNPEMKDWAAAQLRPQCEIDYPRPETRPDIPSLYIAGIEDRAVSIDWMRSASVEVLGQPALEMPTGHCPFLSATQEVANVLTDFAAENVPSGGTPPA